MRILPKLKTIKVSGGNYVPVKNRVVYFREQYPDGRVVTEVIRFDDGIQFLVKATVWPDLTREADYWVGHAYGDFTKSKSLEKAETSAIGRALGLGGIGIVNSTDIASADEMREIDGKSEKSKSGGLFPTQKIALRDMLLEKGIDDPDDQRAIYEAMVRNAGGDENMNYGRGNQLIKDLAKCDLETLKEIAKGEEVI